MSENLREVVLPVVVFFFAIIATMWLRRLAYDSLEKWARKTKWPGDEILVQATRKPSVLWALLISISLGVAVSGISAHWKDLAHKGVWSLLLISLSVAALTLASRFIPFYAVRYKAPAQAIRVAQNVARVAIVALALLILFDIWGVPTSAILLVIGIVALILIVAFRDAIPNVFAWMQLSATGQVKPGDYIRLETGEEGQVIQIDWRSTQLHAADGSAIAVPNRRLVQSTMSNYGRPMKKAREPFRFYIRAHLKELTGLRAKNLKELAETLKTVPDSVVYYHTHHFLEEHHYLTPEPANDFAVWVSDALGDEPCGERLASIDTFEFFTLAALRDRLAGIIEEHLAQGCALRDAMEGSEFHFVKSVNVVLATPYLAHDLREFVETLRKISQGSLFFHIFDARLRLGKGLNDFSVWLENSLDEKELAQAISRLDPYTYTLEGLRSSLIQMIEKRVK